MSSFLSFHVVVLNSLFTLFVVSKLDSGAFQKENFETLLEIDHDNQIDTLQSHCLHIFPSPFNRGTIEGRDK